MEHATHLALVHRPPPSGKKIDNQAEFRLEFARNWSRQEPKGRRPLWIPSVHPLCYMNSRILY